MIGNFQGTEVQKKRKQDREAEGNSIKGEDRDAEIVRNNFYLHSTFERSPFSAL